MGTFDQQENTEDEQSDDVSVPKQNQLYLKHSSKHAPSSSVLFLHLQMQEL